MSTNTLRAPVIGLAPLVGGWIAGRFGCPALFGATKISVALGVAMLCLTLEEPRKGNPPKKKQGHQKSTDRRANPPPPLA
jgi:hypothetical protein